MKRLNRFASPLLSFVLLIHFACGGGAKGEGGSGDGSTVAGNYQEGDLAGGSGLAPILPPLPQGDASQEPNGEYFSLTICYEETEPAWCPTPCTKEFLYDVSSGLYSLNDFLDTCFWSCTLTPVPVDPLTDFSLCTLSSPLSEAGMSDEEIVPVMFCNPLVDHKDADQCDYYPLNMN